MMDRSKPCIVVVNYGSHELLARNLVPLTEEALIVVVDNFRTVDESVAMMRLADDQGWELVVNERNEGFGAAVNSGVARGTALGGHVFILVNPDLELTADALRHLHARSLADPLTMVSPVVVRPDGSRWFDGATVLVDRGRTSTAVGSNSAAPNGWLSGACLVVHADMWEKVGGFDDEYFLYWEDVDLSWRWVEAGGRLIVDEAVTVVHDVGGTQGGQGKSTTYVYYNCRNRMLFATRHLDRRAVRSWLRGSAAYANRVVMRGGRRALTRRPVGLLWAAVRGSVAGTAMALRIGGGSGQTV
jgi:N-acetylglucosaminyl-diphospho-decaprenol L-rhamnosyltransferase